MSKAMLIDTTRCVGCRGCQVACKAWNGLKAERTAFSETGTNPRHLDANTYTRVLFREVSTLDGGMKWVFVKRQCMHGLEPACVSACSRSNRIRFSVWSGHAGYPGAGRIPR